MFIYAYCKIWELNTELQSVFADDVSGFSLKVGSKFFLEQFQIHKWAHNF